MSQVLWGSGLVFGLLLSFWPVASAARDMRPTQANASSFSPVGPSPLQAAGSNAWSTYKIGPLDTLQIDVFQVPDLSRAVQVDGSGMILLPLVGQMPAAGRSVAQLSSDISEALAKTYVKDPLVTVTVKDSQSQRVTVDGAVNQPGIFPLSGPTTLMQAVALAHGPDSKLANLHKVAIFRNFGAQRMVAIYDLAAIRSGKHEDPQVLADDTVVVDTSSGKSFLRDLVGVAPLFSIFYAF
jgi:polysaccharide export outer membrane protein